jgi:hypothetical protein
MTSTQKSPRQITREQEAAWRHASDHNVTEARRRFREIAQRLPISPALVPVVVDAAMEVARFYAMECAYANYELRTGCAYPPERRESEEAQERADWRSRLARLEPARPL